MTATVQITESFKPLLNAIELGFKSGLIDEEIGRGVVKVIQDNFRALPANERGFSGTGFWQRAAEATHYLVVQDDLLISVDQVGVRQRFLGGNINPVRGQYLTIPAIAETYGCSVADFGGSLKVIRGVFVTYWGSVTSLTLVPQDWDEEKAGSAGVYFWLVSRVSQAGNPDVLPSDDDIYDAVSEAVDRSLGELMDGQGSK